MITLSRPKAYGEIKPLRGSTGQPIRCTPSHIVAQSAEIEDRPNCADCQTRSCPLRTGKCDWLEEPQP
jgi:hypothetical protein